MGVVLLLAAIWAIVLVPPLVRAHSQRKRAFMLSFGGSMGREVDQPERRHRHSRPVQRRRQVAGGLLIAMAATLVVGLLPTFRVLLIAHLFLVDSFLAYVALLAHGANKAAKARQPAVAVTVAPEASIDPPATERTRRWVGRRQPSPLDLADLGSLAPLG